MTFVEWENSLQDNRDIALVVDSCTGGLGVLKRLSAIIGDKHIVFLADSQFNPLGTRNKGEISAIVDSWIKLAFRISSRVGTLWLACNTASIAFVRDDALSKCATAHRIMTMVDSFRLMLDKNRDLIKHRRVAVLGTKFTTDANTYTDLVRSAGASYVIGIPATASERVVAKGWGGTAEGHETVRRELRGYHSSKIDTIILACTCFEFLEFSLRSCFGEAIAVLNPADYLSPRINTPSACRPTTKQYLGASLSFMSTGAANDVACAGREVARIMGIRPDVISLHYPRPAFSRE